jgi:hypothetical protein
MRPWQLLPRITFTANLFSDASELSNAGIATTDGGYLMAATIYKPIPANAMHHIVKLDSNLSIQWQKNYRTDNTILQYFL